MNYSNSRVKQSFEREIKQAKLGAYSKRVFNLY